MHLPFWVERRWACLRRAIRPACRRRRQHVQHVQTLEVIKIRPRGVRRIRARLPRGAPLATLATALVLGAALLLLTATASRVTEPPVVGAGPAGGGRLPSPLPNVRHRIAEGGAQAGQPGQPYGGVQSGSGPVTFVNAGQAGPTTYPTTADSSPPPASTPPGAGGGLSAPITTTVATTTTVALPGRTTTITAPGVTVTVPGAPITVAVPASGPTTTASSTTSTTPAASPTCKPHRNGKPRKHCPK